MGRISTEGIPNTGNSITQNRNMGKCVSYIGNDLPYNLTYSICGYIAAVKVDE